MNDFLSKDKCFHWNWMFFKIAFSLHQLLTLINEYSKFSVENFEELSIVSGVIPIVVLTFLNFSIIQTMKKNNLIHNKMCTVERWKYFHQFQKYFFILSDETKPWLLFCLELWLFWWFAILQRLSSTSMNVIRLKNKILHLNLNCGV